MDLKTLDLLVRTDANGVEHRLGRFWQEQPVALIFLRHFG